MKTARYIVVVLVALSMLLGACAPAATPVPTQAPAPTTAPTKAPEPTAVPTKAPEATKPPAPTATVAPTVAVSPSPAPTATTAPAACTPLANPVTVKAGELGSADKPIVITFVPSGDSGKITKAGNDIATCLAKQTGLNFKIEVGTSFGASIEAMGANKAQVGFLNTFSVLLAVQKYQIVPALAVMRKYATTAIDPDQGITGIQVAFYKGEFIANTKANIKTFADLKGKTFCFVDPNSTSGYIVPRIILKANGIDPDKDFKAVVNAGSHPNVATAVYNGDCDAGVSYIDILTDAASNLKGKFPDIQDKVKAFAVTDRIPNDGVQFVKTLDPKIQQAVSDGLVAMSKDPGGNAVLRALYTIDGFQVIKPDFYDAFAGVLKKAGVDPATLVK